MKGYHLIHSLLSILVQAHSCNSNVLSYHFQIEPGDTLPSLAIRYGVAVDAIKRVNAIVTDSDMYARETVRIPVFTRMGQTSAERGDSNSNSERPRIRPEKNSNSRRPPEKVEVQSDFFSKFDASVRDNAERARNTLDRMRLDENEGSDTEGDYEVFHGEGTFELRKCNA